MGGLPPLSESPCIDYVSQSGSDDNTNLALAQLDGNTSLTSSEIDILVKDKVDKIFCALNLPSVATYNMRSVFPKISNLKDDILERSIDCAFLVEIWEKAENKKHQYEIEKMLELNGLKYLSTARPGGWGGAALIVNEQKFSLERININIPHNLEVIWGLLKPKAEDAFFKKIIVCSF